MCARDQRYCRAIWWGSTSKYRLFSLFAWYLTDVIHLPGYFAQVSVNRKRNHGQQLDFGQIHPHKWDDMGHEMCEHWLSAVFWGLSRMSESYSGV